MALATAPGSAAIAMLRLSGPQAYRVLSNCFFDKKQRPVQLASFNANTVHFGLIMQEGQVLDEVLLSLFKAPHSYTGEDLIEVSCHGSAFIQQQMLQLFLASGARLAEPGEFTLRAFLNGKMDLSQAEAVADLISSNSQVSHQLAMQQMRGGFSSAIKTLRDHLVNFASLIELELDFSEEDVEFANRSELLDLLQKLQGLMAKLISSFDLGNVIKQGLPVAIVGKPNAGKSTLLNVLLQEERAIVSEIPGTTRDTIEDTLVINGVLFRVIDTAGLRDTSDAIESIGVGRALEAMKKAGILIYLFDLHSLSAADLRLELEKLRQHAPMAEVIPVGNKMDTEPANEIREEFADFADILFISAKNQSGIEALKERLVAVFDQKGLNSIDTVVSNARHVNALKNAQSAMEKVIEGLKAHIPGDLLALDIRYALDELGMITGQVTTEDLLENIFSKFCIGK